MLLLLSGWADGTLDTIKELGATASLGVLEISWASFLLFCRDDWCNCWLGSVNRGRSSSGWTGNCKVLEIYRTTKSIDSRVSVGGTTVSSVLCSSALTASPSFFPRMVSRRRLPLDCERSLLAAFLLSTTSERAERSALESELFLGVDSEVLAATAAIGTEGLAVSAKS